MNILRSRKNPEGAKLEEHLDLLINDVAEKSLSIIDINEPSTMALRIVLININDKIIDALKKAKELQVTALELIEKEIGPDKGPKNPL